MKRNWKTLILTLSVTFVLMILLVIFTIRTIYRTAFSYVNELGDDKTMAITADLENYLENAKSVLWVAADSVDHMVSKGATTDDIVEYITRESTNTEAQFDESYTGLYGVIDGTYVDGVGWVPPDDYDPTKRDWYKTTVRAKGEAVIVSPYVDAQTRNVIISIGKSLSDPKNALAMDLTLSGVQEMTEGIEINGCGYGFILNSDGMVIAHKDKNENGKYYNKLDNRKKLYEKAMSVGKGNFEMEIDGEECTVFVDTVMDQWHLVIVTESKDLFREPTNLFWVSIIINLVVFTLISIFYIFGYRYERKIYRRVEALKASEQKREYEAKLLKLEKSAADTANKAKSDFLADMSHEIRTPINAVLGMNEMILQESKDEEIIDYASNIKSAGNTLLSIINTILDFSKIEDGRMRLVPVEFDVTELLNGLVNSISEQAKAKKLDFEVEVDESIPSKLFGDDVRISQIIMNLLTNAVKYTEEGTVTLRMLDRSSEAGKARLLVEVEDTGIGIKEEDLDKLAVSFERIEERRNRHIEGTGLGISIVTKLLAMMDSELKVESVYGEGSKFSFELNLQISEAEPIGKYDEKNRVVSTDKEDAKRLRAPKANILVTDDNKMNLKVVANLLKLFGILPTRCSSGKETVELLRNNSFDLIFLDHMMPEMDGVETLKVLKEENLLDGAPVIALTANAVVGAKEQYLEAGFDDYISKPISTAALEQILRTYLPESVIEIDDASGDGRGSTEEVGTPDTGLGAVDPVNADNADIGSSSEESLIQKLEDMGLNTSEGIAYSGGEAEFYLEIVSDYADATQEKAANLEVFYKEEDWKNYKILVHSIKSSSKTIGAEELSEKARLLEEASGNEDAGYVKANHDELIREFTGLSEKIKEIM